jgi:hypothetical protein
MWDTSVIFKRLPVVNYRPLGENSPNLVTLVSSYISSMNKILPLPTYSVRTASSPTRDWW